MNKLKRYFPIEISYTKYEDRINYDYHNGSTLLPFFNSKKQMWVFRVWKGGNIFVYTFGIGICGVSIFLKIPRII